MYSQLSVVTAPAVELVSVAEAKSYLRVDHDGDDEDIGGFAVGARLWAEDYCNRAFVTTKYRWSIADDLAIGTPPLIPIPMFVLPLAISGPVLLNQPWELPRSTVSSVTLVTITTRDGEVVTLTTDDYRTDLSVVPARLQLGWSTVPRAYRNVTIEFIAGYGATVASVPANIRTGVKSLIAWLYEHRGDAPDSPDMPATARRMLQPSRVYFV